MVKIKVIIAGSRRVRLRLGLGLKLEFELNWGKDLA